MIDALRGLAAVTVYLSHADHSRLVAIDALTVHKEFLGTFGVYLFFILSGYLIWDSARRSLPEPKGLQVYAVHRLTRVLPLYFVNLAFVLLLLPSLGATFTPNVEPVSVLRHLFLTQSLLPSVSRDLNPVLWTLTHEVLFYLCVPVLFWLSLRARVEWLLVAGSLLFLPVVANLTGPFQPFAKLFFLFAIGILLQERLEHGAPIWAPLPLAALALCGGLLWMYGGQLSVVAPAVLVFVCGLLIARRDGSVFRWLRPLLLPLAAVGIFSYSLYIWHYLLLHVIAGHTDILAGWLGRLWQLDVVRAAIVSVAIFGASWLSYLLIERPAMGPLRRRLMPAALRK